MYAAIWSEPVSFPQPCIKLYFLTLSRTNCFHICTLETITWRFSFCSTSVYLFFFAFPLCLNFQDHSATSAQTLSLFFAGCSSRWLTIWRLKAKSQSERIIIITVIAQILRNASEASANSLLNRDVIELVATVIDPLINHFIISSSSAQFMA